MKFIDTESRTVVARRQKREGEGKFLFNGYIVLVLQDERSFGDRLHNNVKMLHTTEL